MVNPPAGVYRIIHQPGQKQTNYPKTHTHDAGPKADDGWYSAPMIAMISEKKTTD
jgi:hypothetical protein